jgi:ABC-type Fe3+-hydroxamate transport system substrate-binding protein
VRAWIGALALAAMAVALAACSGGSATSATPSGSPEAVKVPAICVNVASLRTTVERLTSMQPDAAGMVAIRLAANNVATQTATFVSGAPIDLRQAAEGLKTAVGVVRTAAVKAGASAADVAATITGVDAAWRDFEAKLATVCPTQASAAP